MNLIESACKGLAVPGLLACLVFAAPASAGEDYAARVHRVLNQTPLIDGHNDLPWEIRDRFKNDLSAVDLHQDTRTLPFPKNGAALMTDLPRLRKGEVGGQFWSVWIPTSVTGPLAVQMTAEQIDLTKRMTQRYAADMEMAYTAADIRRIHQAHKIASLIGIEGGHQINNSLSVLRQMYDLGARYMTLTHTSNTDWADSATDSPVHQGLTPFGEQLVAEMNRLGMLVDLSHVSPQTMQKALAVSQAPVMYSHSSARALADHPRNVPDDILRAVAANGGVVMVNFAPGYVSEARRLWDADEAAEKTRYNSPPYVGLYIGQPEKAAEALAAWKKTHPAPHATLKEVADHVEHIAQIAGHDHVGLGSDFDGIDETPIGLEGVDCYPALLSELMRRGWGDSDIAKLAGDNVLRVMAAVEKTAAKLQKERPASAAVFQPAPSTPSSP